MKNPCTGYSCNIVYVVEWVVMLLFVASSGSESVVDDIISVDCKRIALAGPFRPLLLCCTQDDSLEMENHQNAIWRIIRMHVRRFSNVFSKSLVSIVQCW